MHARVATSALLASSVLLAVAACHSSRPAARDAAMDAGNDTPASASIDAGGCRSNDACPSDQYCAYTPGLCGKGKRTGACRPRPRVCDHLYAPVCGCDGKTYPSECAAHAAGVDLAVMGGCREAIADFAPCGPRYCDVRTSYCEIFLSDVFELPTDHFCRPLPPTCVAADGASPTCDCFPDGTPCRSFCGVLPTAPGARSGFHLTCQGRHPPAE